MDLREIGVVGGGIMGAGIVHSLLTAGYAVSFKELNQELLERSLARVDKIFESAKKKGKISDDEIKDAMSKIRSATDYSIFSSAELVIEAVPERLDRKREVFQKIDKTCPAETIFASNTSSLSISELGGFTQRPAKVIGMHWFNPSHVMKLVEIVPGLETSQETISSLFQLCHRLDKVPIQVKECAGFLVNRLLGIYVNEALQLVEDGYTPQTIDHTAESVGMPMGPVKLGDMVGWDTIYHANTTLHYEYGTRFAVPTVLRKVFENKQWGAKVGQGFYRYERGRMAEEEGERRGPEALVSSRLITVMMNEGIRCLDENVASLQDIDKAMMVGAGMPKGPLQWADEMGLDQLLTQLEKYHDAYGDRFLPAPLLRRKVAAKHLGIKTGMGFHKH
jgi:3-hydroxyacyl-CoA dehydrogenase